MFLRPFAYNQFLILYDIFCNDYDQIFSNLRRERITAADIKIIIEYIETFTNEIISEYWKERLLTA